MKLVFTILMAIFLPCIGLGTIFLVYMCLLWCATARQSSEPVKPVSDNGLSLSDLEKLPTTTGKDLDDTEPECAVCLDEITEEQPARVIPGCNHSFHLECADRWLSKHRFCPLCRTELDPDLLCSSQNPC